jgi:hypothetical protein
MNDQRPAPIVTRTPNPAVYPIAEALTGTITVEVPMRSRIALVVLVATVAATGVVSCTVDSPTGTVLRDGVARLRGAGGDSTGDTTSTPPRDSIPGDSIPGDSIPGDSIPRDSIPRDAIPRDSIPRDSIPRDSIPRDSIPRDTTGRPPRDSVPRDTSGRPPRDSVPRDTSLGRRS